MSQRLFILGANGFIGSHLIEHILHHTDWMVDALDLRDHKLQHLLGHPRLTLTLADMTQPEANINARLQAADVVVPLAAIANPALYVKDPLRVFSLDFEANLPIVRACVEHKKRLVFPSTSEVYGMCTDEAFDEEHSSLVLGPVHKERWIYACSKQMMDRIIFAYGAHQGLDYTLFRPFNWIGPKLDDLGSPHPTRSLTQFIDGILNKGRITLVDGGAQRRCFTDIEDGIAGLMRILENPEGRASQKIYNLGNPNNEHSIAELVHALVATCAQVPSLAEKANNVVIASQDAQTFYGEAYQDVQRRVPAIAAAQRDLGWTPKIALSETLEKTIQHILLN